MMRGTHVALLAVIDLSIVEGSGVQQIQLHVVGDQWRFQVGRQ